MPPMNAKELAVLASLSFELLRPVFYKPLSKVAVQYGVCATVFKKRARELGIKRWPFRKIRSLRRSIAKKNCTPAERAIMEEQIEAIHDEQYHVAAVADHTKASLLLLPTAETPAWRRPADAVRFAPRELWEAYLEPTVPLKKRPSPAAASTPTSSTPKPEATTPPPESATAGKSAHCTDTDPGAVVAGVTGRKRGRGADPATPAARKRACTPSRYAREQTEPAPFRSPFSAGALAAHNEAQLTLLAHGPMHSLDSLETAAAEFGDALLAPPCDHGEHSAGESEDTASVISASSIAHSDATLEGTEDLDVSSATTSDDEELDMQFFAEEFALHADGSQCAPLVHVPPVLTTGDITFAH